ncbi:bacillithiol biosynthesis cysteine-adding enzyme BshC [Pseudogracilibacillus auburnensis]|uniref:bacillithiol biosynthesis cysteine-adding enzyme BshC n=1 Tax=Pseudogracilibacillus auburnensis TaxID=1494959 RepID=UPI001A963E96|nr:bacillithiol biosynthesis cysteine-adding enzyme BshC [Pseudogracilibacillus auburnensis]MBO1004926.1 bacillithiol biosynthesis cysteine-adding enzyme BshC [Pseudogracilibacillus auburnensis]
MKVENIAIAAMNNFASLYIDQKGPVKDFFHYNITETAVFKERYNDLMERQFDRTGIAECIYHYMKRFPQSEQTITSLEKLRDESSVVIIGGQQAGLLTGPLYTIHKIISIIKLAEEQEKELGKPVIPVFWIAGEDHDYLEINHLFVEYKQSMKKISYPEKMMEKRMASDIFFHKEEMKNWLEEIFAFFGERKYTKENLELLHTAISNSESVTDFFAYIIMSLFKDYGLLIIDSADDSLRLLEKPYFSTLIERCSDITEAVLQQQELINSYGLPKVMEIENDAANLFYYLNHERILLDYSQAENQFTSDKTEFQVTNSELYEMLNEHPQKFSNNVVTRPIMQEWLFPSLAFIAGPGEIAYWGELKKAFETLEMKMPPIIPRLNITFLSAAIERDIKELELSIIDVISNGVEKDKKLFLETMSDKKLHEMLHVTENFIKEQYAQIIERISKTDRGLLSLSEKNLSFHLEQIEFLKQKSDQSLHIAHQAMLEKYNRIECSLRPEDSPQERMWNIFFYLNIYGPEFIHELMRVSYTFDGTHKLIRI